MKNKEEAKLLIQQYNDEINKMKDIDVEKIILDSYKETKKSRRGGSRGRVASDDYSLMLDLAQFDCMIAESETKIALWKNQIKLRKERDSETKENQVIEKIACATIFQ